jgi:hypothetical protein
MGTLAVSWRERVELEAALDPFRRGRRTKEDLGRAYWQPVHIVRGAGTARFHRMEPRDLRTAARSLPLTERSITAIRADLERQPAARLAELLRGLLEEGRWVEQEAFLAQARPSRTRIGDETEPPNHATENNAARGTF